MPTQLIHVRRSPPPPSRPGAGSGTIAGAGTSTAQRARPIPPMMPMPPPFHHHYKYFPGTLGRPRGARGLKRGHAAEDEATASGPSSLRIPRLPWWAWEHPRTPCRPMHEYEAGRYEREEEDTDLSHPARTSTGRSGAVATSFHRQHHRMVSSGGPAGTSNNKADEEGQAGACEPSSSQEDMLESALLLASLARSPPKKNDIDNDRQEEEEEEDSTEEEEQELPTTPTSSNVSRVPRRDNGADDLSVAAEGPVAAQPQPPPPVLPQVQAEGEVVDSIPKPNIVTPVSSETGVKFVEELHHHQRVDFPPPDRSFYELQERGAGYQPPRHNMMARPSIFRSPPPPKKRDRGEEGASPESNKKARSVRHNRQAYPVPPGYFVGPMPPMRYPPASDYPFPYQYPYPQGYLAPRFDSRRDNRDESSPSPLPSKSPSPQYPPHSHPFPPPYFPSSPPPDGPSTARRHHQMMVPMPPHHAYNPMMFQHTDRDRNGPQFTRKVAKCKPEFQHYPAIASLDPVEAYHAGRAVITRSQKWAWRDFPELEAFLVNNRDEYLRHSAMNYTPEQKEYNNRLTEQLLEVADESGYVFHSGDFDFVSIRDRIRCYYKSYVQANKKKGKIVSYPKLKREKIEEARNKILTREEPQRRQRQDDV